MKTNDKNSAAYNRAFNKLTAALDAFAATAANLGPPVKSISYSYPGSNGAIRSIKVRHHKDS